MDMISDNVVIVTFNKNLEMLSISCDLQVHNDIFPHTYILFEEISIAVYLDNLHTAFTN